MTPYYILACAFGFGLALLAAYGLKNPDFARGKAVFPFFAVAAVLAVATLGSAIYGAAHEEHGGDAETAGKEHGQNDEEKPQRVEDEALEEAP